jgi:geranylgeranyl pyrophosphate synthase
MPLPDESLHAKLREAVESALSAELHALALPAKPESRLGQAVRHAVFPGGKRFRPALALLGARAAGGDLSQSMPAACAVEFIHASSLILDDLPCMDDAAVRRGLPTVHRLYGEDVAVLAAITLLNRAYAIFGRRPELIREATDCIGVAGMIGGQFMDLDPTGWDAPLAERNRKTSALMRLSLTAGALACGVPADRVSALGRAGVCLGEAYQIFDDVLDADATPNQTGKTAGQDKRHNRPSHAAVSTNVTCAAQALALIADARQALRDAFGRTRAVADLIRFVDGIVESFPSGISHLAAPAPRPGTVRAAGGAANMTGVA